jgi:type VII secretion-associated protein (TIGR03931 family)
VVKAKSKWLPWIVVGSVVLVIAAGVTVFRLVTAAPEGKPVAQYDYRFTAPPGWSQIGGDAANREVQLKPDGSAGQDLIAVQERALDYDATAQRDLAISQVRSAVDKAGSAFSGFSAGVSFAGKDVVYYRQQVDGATVDWYVLLKGKAQVSVGCQYLAGDQDAVRAACQQVVSTLAVDA